MPALRRNLVALTLVSACRSAPLPPPDGTLVVLGRDAAEVRFTSDDPEGATVATWRYPFAAGERLVTERWTHDADGRLRVWSRHDAEGRGRSLRVDPDGAASWTIREGGVDRSGSWQLPDLPHHWASPLPDPGPLPWWDGDRLLPAQADAPEPSVRVVTTADGRAWHLRDAPEQRTARFPDGSALERPGRPVEPWDPATELHLPGPSHPAPRRVRDLRARAGDVEIRVVQPLGPEIPKVPRAGPPPEDPPWTLPQRPDPIDLRLTLADDRLLTVTRALAAIRRKATDRGQSGAPDPRRTLAAGGDCDDLSTLLVAGLAHAQVPAEVVRGWLLTDEARWVRHAWVRVPMAPPVPWLMVDPALGQLPADAARLADDDLPPGAQPDHLTDITLR